jgi:hypothetical protein
LVGVVRDYLGVGKDDKFVAQYGQDLVVFGLGNRLEGTVGCGNMFVQKANGGAIGIWFDETEAVVFINARRTSCSNELIVKGTVGHGGRFSCLL